MNENILTVNNLKKYFETPQGTLHAVDDISFALREGTTLGVVGESGCGKSTLGRTILRLLEPSGGTVLFKGKDIFQLSEREMREKRKDMQFIFQDPFSSLNPRRTVADLIGKPLEIHRLYKTRQEREERVRELMRTVGLASRLAKAYPHELDGGRRQRIGIARAIALNPSFVICDEPVSALDVSIQAQILNLLQDLQDEFSLTFIFITHDLAVVNYFSDEIMVMYLGQMVEQAPSEKLFKSPKHPYTQALLSAIPVPRIDDRPQRILLQGEVRSPIDPKPGCRFSPRCPRAMAICEEKTPQKRTVEDGHLVCCHLYDSATK